MAVLRGAHRGRFGWITVRLLTRAVQKHGLCLKRETPIFKGAAKISFNFRRNWFLFCRRRDKRIASVVITW